MKTLDKNMLLSDLINTEKFITYENAHKAMQTNKKLTKVYSIPNSESTSGEWEYVIADSEQEVNFIYKCYNVWGEYKTDIKIKFKFENVGTDNETFTFQLDDRQPILLKVKVKPGYTYKIGKTYIGGTDGANGLFSFFMDKTIGLEFMLDIFKNYYKNFIDKVSA